MLKVCLHHRTYRSPPHEGGEQGLLCLRPLCDARQGLRFPTAHLYSICAGYHNHITTRYHTMRRQQMSYCCESGESMTYCGNVARMTRPGSGPLYNCILTLPIQKAHILHTHDKKIFSSQVYKSSSTVFRNKETWTSHYQSALSHWCNVTYSNLCTLVDSTYAEKLGMHQILRMLLFVLQHLERKIMDPTGVIGRSAALKIKNVQVT